MSATTTMTTGRAVGAGPRSVNVAAVLDTAWSVAAFTATDVIEATGLARSTAIALCDELIELGWLAELDDSRQSGAEYRKGRPARRYALREDAGLLVGVDAGAHSITAVVTDLRGREVARSQRVVNPMADGDERIAAIDAGIDEALAAAGAATVLCLAIGIPAPVDTQGRSPERDPFWQRVNPRIAERVAGRGCPVIVDNDANLAALAEGAIGAGVGLESYITIVSGERFGAGYVIDGRLVRGRGQAGELHLLDLVEGVGSTLGVGAVLRDWAREQRTVGTIPETSPLAELPVDKIEARAVFEAAAAGDPVALDMLDRVADRLARIGAVLGGLLDVERIVFAGALAPSMPPLLDLTTAALATYMNADPPELVASTLGADIVAQGAIASAMEYVRRNALAIDMSTGPAAP
ncbi:ROK family protein [Labedella populi]|uniref:ROK family protein n=1 Tax=Labedella populi TaxID=2498850 RepID=A0A444QE28_9MICO|nr:ROK family protein [Labedella populi]RWZ67815.1 ROK family protein [Labedella populi]